MKQRQVFMALLAIVFLSAFLANLCFGFGYKPEENQDSEFVSDDSSFQEEESVRPQSKEERQRIQRILINRRNAKKETPQAVLPNQNSVDVDGYNIRSSNPIKVLPPSSSGNITVTGNETVVRQSSGGIQVVGGGDVSVTPND